MARSNMRKCLKKRFRGQFCRFLPPQKWYVPFDYMKIYEYKKARSFSDL